MQKSRVSALLVDRENALILLIKRIKDGRTYWVFPGGGVEANELLEQAIVREIFEETTLKADNHKELFSVLNRGRKEHFFLVNVTQFVPKLSKHSPEFSAQSCTNQYELAWIKLSELNQLDLVPVEAKAVVISLVYEARI